MKTRRFALPVSAALILGVLVSATSAAPAEAATPTISGSVTGPTGVASSIPVGWFSPSTGRHGSVDTDAYGRYELRNPGDGAPFVLFANVDFEYTPAQQSNRRLTAMFYGEDGTSDYLYQSLETFPDAAGSPTVDLALTAPGSISGNVPALKFRTLTLTDLGGHYLTDTPVSSTGTYAFPGLVPGRYRIALDDPDYAPRGYLDYSSTAITVTPGTAIDFVPKPTKSAGISGSLKSSGSPIPNIHVTATTTAGAYYEAVTSDTGRFSLKGMKPGTYTVKYAAITDSSAPTRYAQRSERLTVRSEKTVGAYRNLKVGGTISGSLRYKSSGDEGVTVIAVTSKGVLAARSRLSESSTSFSLKGLATGTYTVYAVEDGSSYATKSVKVTAGKTSAAGTLATVKSTLSIKGTASGAQLVTAESPNGVTGESGVSASGTYIVRGLLPGSYTLTVAAENREDRVYPGVAVSSATTKNVARGTLYGRVSAEIRVEGLVASGGNVTITRGVWQAGFELGSYGALEARVPAGAATLAAPELANPTYFMNDAPFWYDFPAESKTPDVVSDETTDLGVVELVVKR